VIQPANMWPCGVISVNDSSSAYITSTPVESLSRPGMPRSSTATSPGAIPAAAHRGGHDEQAVALAERALELGEAAGNEAAVAQAENTLGILTGRRAHLARAAELAERLGDRSVLVAALNNLALGCAREGDEGRAVELTERALRLCSEQGDRHREAALHNNLADLFHRRGDDEASMAHLKQAVAIFAEVGGEDGEMQPEVWKLVEW
jgi:tetratricopeptide (TPR) repeat protein